MNRMSEPNSTPGVQAAPEDPNYIKYLLNPQVKYKCHFLVGNEALNIAVERIGVVKKMLIAHSNVLRVELEESPIAEKNNVLVTDILPDTFRNFLRYVYGYDNTASLTFTDADNLLYAAEKYNMLPLKSKVCSRLMSLLTYDNICGLLNNPACFQTLELNAAITQILQSETDKVLSNPQFLELSPSAFLHILQQERVQVPEIELWRSAIKWAKNRVGSEDGASLRVELNDHVKHIRVCSLSVEEFCFEVVPSRVLTLEEVAVVCVSQKTKQKQPELTQICNEVEPRRKMELYTPSEPLTVRVVSGLGFTDHYKTKTSFAIISTQEHKIELISLMLCEINSPSGFGGTVKIMGPFMDENGSKTETEISVDFIDIDDVDLMDNGKCVQLLPHSDYSVKVYVTLDSNAHIFNRQSCTFPHFSFTVDSRVSHGTYISHIQFIKYKALMKTNTV